MSILEAVSLSGEYVQLKGFEGSLGPKIDCCDCAAPERVPRITHQGLGFRV